MEIDVALIRHGVEREETGFFGMTDIPVSETGIGRILRKKDENIYPEASLVFSSCLTRCIDTAKIIYPMVPAIALKKLNAPGYGDFEGKSFAELKHDDRFKEWLAAPGPRACPNGEEPFSVLARSGAAFKKLCEESVGKGLRQIAVVSHRLILQAILQRYYVPRKYENWQTPDGGGYLLRYNTLLLTAKILRKI